MYINDFKNLPICQKLYHTQHQGIFLTVIKVHSYIVKLYALDKFYVEVWYDTQRYEMEVTAFDNTALLAAYMEDIDLSCLL